MRAVRSVLGVEISGRARRSCDGEMNGGRRDGVRREVGPGQCYGRTASEKSSAEEILSIRTYPR
jgi:hypothetical protein